MSTAAVPVVASTEAKPKPPIMWRVMLRFWLHELSDVSKVYFYAGWLVVATLLLPFRFVARVFGKKRVNLPTIVV